MTTATHFRVALRADASSLTGLGHVKRSLALAQALQQAGAETCLVTRASDVDTATLAAAAAVRHIELPPARGRLPTDPQAPQGPAESRQAWTEDAGQTAAVLADWRADLVVVDSYTLDARWQLAVRESLGARIAAIDDLGDRDLAVDWLIDHNLASDHRVKYAGRLPAVATLLCGPRFALLAPVYASAARCEPQPRVRGIGIFMGGADSAGLSGRVLEACRQVAGFDGPIEIATTGANPLLAELKQACRRWANTTLLIDSPDLADFFSRHDLQVGAGGGATWERCCIGAPTLALVAADNQRVVIPALVDLGVLATTQPFGATDLPSIGAAVAALLGDAPQRSTMAERARQLVDGLGARRVALAMTASTLTLRPASHDDAALMHAWRNAPATRDVSMQAQEIGWAEHCEWLERMLADTTRWLWVASVGAIPVGVLRYDRHAGGEATVSLYLDPGLHGLGLGSAMLLAGEAQACARSDAPTVFEARVVETNIASQRLFRSAGYRQDGQRWSKPAHSRARTERSQ